MSGKRAPPSATPALPSDPQRCRATRKDGASYTANASQDGCCQLAVKTRRTRDKDWRPSFLAVFAETGNVKAAAAAGGIARSTAYLERKNDAEFAAAWDDSQEEAIDTLEAEAFRRGVIGYEVPVYHGGKLAGTIRKYSDILLLALLNAHGKSRGYSRDSRMQLSGQIEQKHTVRVTTDKRRTYGGKNGPLDGANESDTSDT